jgi:uncharacterized membrane protein
MKRIIQWISIGVLVFSVLSYIFGRWFLPGLITDDVGDWFLWSGAISLFGLLWLKMGYLSADVKKNINQLACAIILLLFVFGMWGIFTGGGQRAYPEMSALIPFYSLVAAIALLVLLGIFNFIGRKRRPE